MADEEAAFLSSMQAANEAAGYENGEGSEEQAESSSDEYDPTQAVQTDLRPPSNAQDPSVQASAHDVSLPDPTPSASAIPLTSTSTSATILRNDTPQSDHQSLSRSMSRASSQSSEENFITGIQHLNKGTPSHTDGVGEMGQAGENGAADMEQKSSLHPVSDSSFNNSTNHVPADNVQIQNDVQAQNPSGLVQNGATNTVPNLAAVLPDTGASSHSESTLKPSMTLPAPSMKEATPSTRAQPPTPSTSAPRARLPHDTIGILEDRIKEDPRGDLQAWLHLINEHKKRAKIDDARSVYERFLSIFPTAVSYLIFCSPLKRRCTNSRAGGRMGILRSDGERSAEPDSNGQNLISSPSTESLPSSMVHVSRPHPSPQQSYNRLLRPSSSDNSSSIRCCNAVRRPRQRLWQALGGLHPVHQVRPRHNWRQQLARSAENGPASQNLPTCNLHSHRENQSTLERV